MLDRIVLSNVARPNHAQIHIGTEFFSNISQNAKILLDNFFLQQRTKHE